MFGSFMKADMTPFVARKYVGLFGVSLEFLAKQGILIDMSDVSDLILH